MASRWRADLQCLGDPRPRGTSWSLRISRRGPCRVWCAQHWRGPTWSWHVERQAWSRQEMVGLCARCQRSCRNAAGDLSCDRPFDGRPDRAKLFRGTTATRAQLSTQWPADGRGCCRPRLEDRNGRSLEQSIARSKFGQRHSFERVMHRSRSRRPL